MSGKRNPERDERVKIPLDPETALRALLAVKPDNEPDRCEDQAGQHEHGHAGDEGVGGDPLS